MESLIEIFESKPAQDVGTFNRIFKKTRIKGYPKDAEVEIHGLFSEDKRKITIGNDTIYMRIVQPKKKPKKPKQEYVYMLPKSEASDAKLPEIYKTLKPSQFMIYMAIQTMGAVDGIEELARQLSIESKTIRNNIKDLIELKLIRTEMVSVNGKSVLKLSIDLS
jgi:predicted HTH transcriptional regulator